MTIERTRNSITFSNYAGRRPALTVTDSHQYGWRFAIGQPDGSDVYTTISSGEVQALAEWISDRKMVRPPRAEPGNPVGAGPSDALGDEKEPGLAIPAPGGATVILKKSTSQDPDRPGLWLTVTGVEDPTLTVDTHEPHAAFDPVEAGLFGFLTVQQRSRAAALRKARSILGAVYVEELTTAAAFIVTGDVLTDDPDLYDEAGDQ